MLFLAITGRTRAAAQDWWWYWIDVIAVTEISVQALQCLFGHGFSEPSYPTAEPLLPSEKNLARRHVKSTRAPFFSLCPHINLDLDNISFLLRR